MDSLFFDLGLVIVAAALIGVVSYFLKQPLILAYIVAGILIVGFFYITLGRVERDLVSGEENLLDESKKRETLQQQHIADIEGKQRELEKAKSGEIETVIAAFPDLYGRLMGKRITTEFFLDEIGYGAALGEPMVGGQGL